MYKLTHTPLSDKEIKMKMKGRVNVIEYNTLKNYNTIEDLLYPYNKAIILYKSKPTYGHWVAMLKYPGKNIIEINDPYGVKVNSEFDWIDPKFTKQSDQNPDYLVNLLLDYMDTGGEVEYNDHKHQSDKKGIATCGDHAIIRLLVNNLNVDQYDKWLKRMAKQSKLSMDEVVAVLVYLL
jgi:hypothetical protein